MSDPLYRKEVLRLAADAHGAGHLASPDAEGSMRNPACGDVVQVELTLDDAGRVQALAHNTKACVLTQASAAILGRDLKNLDRAGVEALREGVAAMLRDGAPPPAPPFDAYTAFEGVAGHRNRHTCVLLPIDAVLAAFEARQMPEPAGEGS